MLNHEDVKQFLRTTRDKGSKRRRPKSCLRRAAVACGVRSATGEGLEVDPFLRRMMALDIMGLLDDHPLFRMVLKAKLPLLASLFFFQIVEEDQVVERDHEEMTHIFVVVTGTLAVRKAISQHSKEVRQGMIDVCVCVCVGQVGQKDPARIRLSTTSVLIHVVLLFLLRLPSSSSFFLRYSQSGTMPQHARRRRTGDTDKGMAAPNTNTNTNTEVTPAVMTTTMTIVSTATTRAKARTMMTATVAAARPGHSTIQTGKAAASLWP